MDISIIIVNYKSKGHTLNCIKSIKEADFIFEGRELKHEIIVVDNNSGDALGEIIKWQYPEVIFIQNENNPGLGAANNIGIKKAKGDYIVIMNPDTIALDKVFPRLYKYMEENKWVGIVGPKQLNPDKSIQNSSRSIQALSENSDTVSRTSADQFELVQKSGKEMNQMLSSLEIIYGKLEGQNTDVEETSQQMDRMLDAIEGIGTSIQSAVAHVKALDTSVHKGQAMVVNSISSIENIKEVSRKINDIIDMINDLAEQTNLLSMNASIEAAHAGNSGRGFAVVAGEIKKLAASSSQQATGVISHVKEINSSIDAGVAVNREVLDIFKEITEKMTLTSQTMSEVSSRLEEQREASNTISESLNSLREQSRGIKNEVDAEGEHGRSVGHRIDQLVQLSDNLKTAVQGIVNEIRELTSQAETLKTISRDSTNQAQKLENLLNS